MAVLFISGGKAKLANITPVISKKGEDVALACYDACTLSNQLTEKDLESKIVGVTGDGAFAKGNAPFKNKMEVLFKKKLVVRWDLLHLINRAHIDAKGKVDIDDDCEMYENDRDEEDIEISKETLISELINFIQKGAKQYRHGIKYSKLKQMTLGKFKRPKVWSQTRMVAYEFEMILRFLENSVFLDIPDKFLLLAKCQCLVMFSLKIILKNVQRMDITPTYVNSVVVGEIG